MKMRFCIALWVFFPMAPVFGDGAPNPLRGGISAQPDKSLHRGIVMESEEVTLLLYDEPKVDITASMVMYNPGDKDVSMTMGFPAPYQEDLASMEVKADGKAVKTRGYYEENYRNPPYWRVWEIVFPAGARTTVTVGYTSRPDTYLHHFDFSGFYDKVRADKKTIPRRRYFLKNFSRWTAQYILQTGSQWDGKITKAVFRVRHVKKGSSVLRGIVPCFYTNKVMGTHCVYDEEQVESYWNIIGKSNNFPRKSAIDLSPEELVIVFTDIKPKFSLGFVYNPFLGAPEETKMWEKISRAKDPEAEKLGKSMVLRIKRFHEEKRVFPLPPPPKN